MKKIKYLIIILFLFIGIRKVYAFQTFQSFDNTIKLYDYAQILTDKEENKLKEEVNKYIKEFNIDMVLVTVKYYDQSLLQDYMNEFYTKNNFGIGDNNDGIMVVIDFKNNKENVDIKTFGLASTLYSENEIKNILDVMNKEDSYDKKISKFINYSNKYINEFDNTYSIVDNNILLSIDWLGIIIISLTIPSLVTVICLLNCKKLMKEESVNCFISKNNVVINKKEDKFITTNTKKTRITNKKIKT